VVELRSELARKSKTYLISAVLGESILIVVLVYIASSYEFKLSNMSSDDRVALLILGVSALIYFFWTLPILFTPNIRIEYDEKGIYIKRIGNSEQFIPYRSIKNIELRFSRGKYLNARKFGKLMVYTSEKKHVIHNIEEIEQVKNDLEKLVGKHKIDNQF
jgi:membrane protein YdbS with pleckstrin-like domain